MSPRQDPISNDEVSCVDSARAPLEQPEVSSVPFWRAVSAVKKLQASALTG
jgi:hypothetical protein